MSPAAVELIDVEVRHGARLTIERATLTVRPAATHVLLGPSGSGKTTLLRAVAGFEPLAGGRIEIDGRRVDTLPPEARGVGFVFQDYALFPHLDVARNVAFGMRRRDPSRVAALLERVGLGGHGARRPDTLSGGEQQRVALARALAQEPRVVLLDEPFSNLDRSLRERVRDETARLLREAGVAAIFVTHDAEEAFALADGVSVLHRGRIVQTGSPDEIYRRPISATVARLGGGASLVRVAAVVDERRVSTALGVLETHGASRGPWVVVRPEQVALSRDAGDGVPARVVARRFLGAVEAVELEAPGGTRVVARVPVGAAPDDGESVQVRVVGRVVPVDADDR